MRPPFSWLLRVYPRKWRDRYGHEIEALVDDSGRPWRYATDIFIEALRMRLTTLNFRVIGIFALLGLVVATLISLRIPDRFVSVAVVKLLPGAGSDTFTARQEMAKLARTVTSRTALSNIIQNPAADLYKQERSREPLEDVIEGMKARDLSVTIRPDGVTLVSYRGTSPTTARTVVRLMVDLLREDLARGSRLSPTAGRLEVVDAPSFDEAPVYPNRLLISILGVFVGILVAFALVLLRKAPGLWFRGSLALLTLALLSWFLPFPYECRSVVVFDSPATARALRAEVEKSLRKGVTLTLDPQATGLVIRARDSDRFVAQKLNQAAIIRLVDITRARQSGSQIPWVEVLDPPSLPVYSFADPWRDRGLATALILLLVSGSLLLLNRRREVQTA